MCCPSLQHFRNNNKSPRLSAMTASRHGQLDGLNNLTHKYLSFESVAFQTVILFFLFMCPNADVNGC